MDPHPLANLFKRPNYDEPIASELSALDYLYEYYEKFDSLHIVLRYKEGGIRVLLVSNCGLV